MTLAPERIEHTAAPTLAPGREGGARGPAPRLVPWTGGRNLRILLAVLALLTAIGIIALVSLVVSGPEPRAKWGFTAATLVFLLSTAQAGPLVALASRLTTGYWGIPLRRVAALCGVSGVVTAPLLLVLLFELPDWTGRASIWQGWPGAPRLWDAIAIAGLALLGLVMIYLDGLPDLAVKRDVAANPPSWFARLAPGWRGTSRQWQSLTRGLGALGGLYLMLFAFVHLVVSSDLALSLVPAWNDADLPPYQIASSLEGGLATVILVLAALRHVGGLREYLPRDTFHATGKILLALSLFWFYFVWSELLTYWYGREPSEQLLLGLLMFGPALIPFCVSVLLCFVLPFLILLWNSVRASVAGPTVAAACVLVGLFVDRVRIYDAAWSVAGPANATLEALPPAHLPGLQDGLVAIGMIAAVVLLYGLGLRLLPAISPWEWEMRRLVKTDVRLVRTRLNVLAKPVQSAHESAPQQPPLSPARVDRDLVAFVMRTPRWFWIPAGVLGAMLAAAVVCTILLMVDGLQIAGYTNTVYWAFFITNFVFWIEISHAGVLMSAMLRLTKAQWRRPITRAAESMAIFALMTAGIFPIIHTGRLWRTLYWIFPYDFSRSVWPNIRSPLIWDPSAIVTYLLATVLFVITGLIPDLAVVRDRASGWRRRVYGILALGYRGTSRQWRIQHASSMLLSALVLPVFVSVTSIVAWDFAMATLPEWHSTAYAPYFVIGAVHSGIAAVVTLLIVLRRMLHLEEYVTPHVFDVIGRLQLVVLLTYLFFFITDFYFSVFGRDPVEVSIWELRLLTPPTSLLFYIQIITSIVIPLPVWLSYRLRMCIPAMLATAILVNVGMWLEHYLEVVTPLSYKQPFTFTWVPTYTPTPVEIVLTLASVATVALGILLFAKVFPIVPPHSIKEGQLLRRQIPLGRLRMPAAIHED